MQKTVKRSISALLTVFMAVSAGAMAFADSGKSVDLVKNQAAGDNSNLYEIEVFDKYAEPITDYASRTVYVEENGQSVAKTFNFKFDYTYTSLVSHGRYVNNTLYVDQHEHHTMMTLQQWINTRPADFFANLSEGAVIDVDKRVSDDIDPYGLREGTTGSDEYGVVLHVSAKTPQGEPLSVVAENPYSGEVKAVNLKFLKGTDYDKYYLLGVGCQAQDSSFITVSQGGNTGIYSIPLVKGIPWTRTYVQETEYYEQSGENQVIASYDPFNGGINPGRMNYVSGYMMHFDYVRRGTENGQATNDYVDYILLNSDGVDITDQALNVDYDNRDNPKGTNYKKAANVTISDYAGSTCTLNIVIRSAAYGSLQYTDPNNDLYRRVIPIYMTKTEEIPINSIEFKKASYTLTTGKDNAIDLSDELNYAPSNTTDRIVYQSSNPSVASVDKKTGKVSALKAGETTITAYGKFNGSLVASCKVIVKADITNIVISDIDPIIQGHSAEVVYSVSPSGADKQMITWTLANASDSKYLTISGPDQFGKVTLYAPVTNDWGQTQTSRTVTLTAKTTVGNMVTATKSVTIQKNVNAVGINFTATNYDESGPLSKSCQQIGTDEYTIYDEQKALIKADLKNAEGQNSTDVLLWRLTIDDGSNNKKDLILDSTTAKNYISYTFDPDTPGNRGIIVTFKKNMHNVVTLTAYAVSSGESINNAHAEKSIVFHPNTKTTTFTYQAPSGHNFSEMAIGDEWNLPYYMEPGDDTNTDGVVVRSSNDSVLTVEVDKEHQQLKIKAVGRGDATIYAYATYNESLTTSSDYQYYTKPFQQDCKVKYNMENATVTQISDKVFKNADFSYTDIANELVVKYNGTLLTKDVHYDVTLTNNRNAGTCTVAIKAITGTEKSYAGTKYVTFNIIPYDLNADYAQVDMSVNNPTNYYYTGKGVNAAATLKVTFGNNVVGLNSSTDYTLSYMQNIDAGSSAVVYATGKGNYTGTIQRTFTINPRDINDANVVNIDNLYVDSNGKVVYTGQAYAPDIVARNRNTGDYLVKGTDYNLSYSGNINAGEVTVTISGMGNYGKSTTKKFTILKKSISEDDITVDSIPNYTYNNGAGITPVPVVKYNGMTLKKGTDFNVSYSNNANAGKATVTISGTGNYDSSRTATFTIDPYTLTADNTTVTVNQITYTGKALTPGLTVKSNEFNKNLGRDNDFTVAYSNNINAGDKAVVTITGSKNYQGTFTANFVIDPAHVNAMDISDIPEEFFDGTEHKPDIVAKNRETGAALKAGVDYYLEYEKNVDVGNARVIVNGMGNYTGTRDKFFRIAAANIKDCQISTIEDQTFNFGEGIRPKTTVKYEGKTLVEGTDYRIDYKDNYNVGTATMTFVGLGDYGGSCEKTFKILPYALTEANTTITIDAATYDGSAKTPFVKVELKANGRVIGRNDEGNGDYKVAYSNNINSGSNAVVTITGTKNFTGTVTQKFTINGFDINSVGAEAVPEQDYTGKAVTPKVKLTYKDKTLVEGTDYKLSYADNVNSGEATITVTGLGNFFGTKTIKFRIKNAAIVFNEKNVNVVAGGETRLPYSASDKVTFTSSDKKIATVNSDGLVKGKMAGQVTITGKTASGISATITVQVLYKDVQNKSDFWYEPTYYLTNNGVAKGYDNQTNFKPANDCSRAQMVTFLWRLAGQPNPKAKTTTFKDVKTKDYFFKPVLWAVEKGITTGVSKTKFDPQGICTRAQTVTFLWRMAGKPAPKAKTSKFKDVKSKDYFFKATIWASEKKIVAGYSDGTFKPQGKCLRRQMVTFLYKYDKYINGKG